MVCKFCVANHLVNTKPNNPTLQVLASIYLVHLFLKETLTTLFFYATLEISALTFQKKLKVEILKEAGWTGRFFNKFTSELTRVIYEGE